MQKEYQLKKQVLLKVITKVKKNGSQVINKKLVDCEKLSYTFKGKK